MSRKEKAGKTAREASRNIPTTTKILLAVAAGGRCEFPGCNQYLFEHPLTLKQGNYSEYAHIVAFSDVGPRARDGKRPDNINDIANLMLLCQVCHKQIDDNYSAFPRTTLEKYKQDHEERIRHVTGLGPEMRTTVVQLKARIGSDAVDIPLADVTSAVAPRYPSSTKGEVIDLSPFSYDDESFVISAQREIAKKVTRLYEPGMDAAITRHISLFALAPIHLLVYLGSRLSNKIPVELFQRHRDGTNPWIWKPENQEPVKYEAALRRAGKDAKKVAFILSLSGTIPATALPALVDDSFFVYEITISGRTPSTDFLRARADLEEFRRTYREWLGLVRRDHHEATELHLFPAVPAPIAVACGHDLLPKKDPSLVVYDYDKAKNGFVARATINPNDKNYE